MLFRSLAEVSSDPAWLAGADELAGLFRRRLFDPTAGVLAERFHADWRRLEPAVIEPGHQFEWIWLLDRLARAGGSDLTDEAARLWAFASTQGIDSESDLAWDGVFTNGRRAKPTHRLWGQTELLKAQLSRLEQGADRSSAGVAATVDAIFRHHLDPAPEACWRDQLNEDLRWTDDKIPASSLYHLTLAFSELLRVAELLEASRE